MISQWKSVKLPLYVCERYELGLKRPGLNRLRAIDVPLELRLTLRKSRWSSVSKLIVNCLSIPAVAEQHVIVALSLMLADYQTA